MKRLITILLLVLQAIWVSAQLPCIVANYELNGNVIDSVSSNNNGTNYGAVATIDRYGMQNCAYAFNGSTSYIDLGSDFDYPQRTYSLWFNCYSVPTVGAWGVICATDHASLQYGLVKFNSSNDAGTHVLNFGIGSSNWRNYRIEAINHWYHAALSVSTNWIKFYFDGVLRDSMPNNDFGHSTNGINKTRLGCSRINQHFFYGAVDQVKIFNCALTDNQINTLYLAVDEISDYNIIASVYPSPTSDIVNIEISDIEACRNAALKIYDMNGQLMLNHALQGKKTEININDFPTGIYVLKISGPKINMIKKLIKE